MSDFFAILGYACLIYFFGKLLHFLLLFREDSGTRESFVDTIIGYASVFLYVCSFPVSLAFGFIRKYEIHRLCSIHEKELLETKLNFSRLCSRCRENGYYDPELAKEPESWEPLD